MWAGRVSIVKELLENKTEKFINYKLYKFINSKFINSISNLLKLKFNLQLL